MTYFSLPVIHNSRKNLFATRSGSSWRFSFFLFWNIKEDLLQVMYKREFWRARTHRRSTFFFGVWTKHFLEETKIQSTHKRINKKLLLQRVRRCHASRFNFVFSLVNNALVKLVHRIFLRWIDDVLRTTKNTRLITGIACSAFILERKQG